MATVWKESGSWRWAALQVMGLTALAYAVSLLAYRIGLLVT
jgi:Fe2+ transport system protein B